jgi:hypothetical protein
VLEYGVKEGCSVHDALRKSTHIHEIAEGDIVGTFSLLDVRQPPSRSPARALTSIRRSLWLSAAPLLFGGSWVPSRPPRRGFSSSGFLSA